MNLIAAVDNKWGIGYKNKLLISIPDDMKQFMQATTGGVCIMGKGTLMSLPAGKPLKNRVNIGIEFSMRKLFADDFDVTHNEPGFNLNEPYGIKSSILKNQDWYSLILIFLTWEFNKKEDPC